MKEILVFGSGGHAKVVIDLINAIGGYKIIGVVDQEKSEEGRFLDYPLFGEKELCNLNVRCAVIAIGDNKIRKRIAGSFTSWGLKPETLIHPSSVLGENVKIAKGSMIMAGVVVNCHTTIGEHCIINTSASIDHDCIIQDFANIAPGVTFGGDVKIGPLTHIGLGAKIIQQVSVGESSIIGAGAVLVKNFPSKTLGMGLPCRPVKKL